MLAQVTTIAVRNRYAERLRFPSRCQSGKGESALREWRKPHPMDRRLIFLHLYIFRWSNGVQYAKRIIGFDVRVVRMVSRKIRSLSLMRNSSSAEIRKLRPRRFCKARSQEKLLRLNIYSPYRKPTQVVRASSPRRTSEMSPRNSAKKRPYLRYKAFQP